MVRARPRVGLPSSVKLLWKNAHRHTKERVPQVTPNPVKLTEVMTNHTRSQIPPKPNKQTNKEGHAQFPKRVSLRSHWSPAIAALATVSYNVFFCFLNGTVGTRSSLIQKLVAYPCAVCFLIHSLMAGIGPYHLYPGSQLAYTSIFYGWPCVSTPFTMSLL